MDSDISPRLRRDILIGQVRLLYDQATPGFVATLINSLLLVGALWTVEPRGQLLAWLLGMSLITLGRVLLVRRFRRATVATHEARRWARLYVVGAGLAGAAWGVGATLLYPHDSVPHQMVLLIVIAGMSAGGITFLSPVREAYLAYTLPMLPPLAVLLFLEGTEVHPFLGLLTLIYLASLLVTSKRLHMTVTEALRLKHEKDRLLDDLERSEEELQGINALLSDKLLQLTTKERELQDSNRFLSMIMDNASDAIFSLDGKGRFTHVNDATARITGYTREQLLGRPFAMLFPAEVRETRTQRLLALMRGDRRVTHQLVDIERADGSSRTLQYAITPLADDDELGAIVGTAEDVTEHIRAARLKEEFVSTVSHELRTPLTAIRGALSLLGGDLPAGAEAHRDNLLQIAQRNSDRLVYLINDLLDIQKLEAGKMPFVLRDVALTPFLNEVIDTNQAFAEQFDVTLCLAQDDPTLSIRVDPDRLQQAMANLLSNAAKFSPPGETVEVRTQRRDGRARISVIDHGPGITADFRDRIFQKFAQADASDTRQRGGTGLGLSLTKGIIENMGGVIDFESHEGEGSTFYVELPLAEAV